MKIMHWVGKSWQPADVGFLADYGIAVSPGSFSYIRMEPAVFYQVRDRVLDDSTLYKLRADFEPGDLDSADWLALSGLTENGYPQPEDPFAYREAVYDHSCPECGIPGRQVNPLRILSDKTKLDAFFLTWVFDEIFVKKALYEDMFFSLGIGYNDVVLHRSGTVSTRIVQLDVPDCEWDFDMSGVSFEVCSACGQKKYAAQPIDFLPELKGEPPNELFRGREFHGSGGQAFRRIFLSQKMRQELISRGITKPSLFYPLVV